MLAMLKLEIMIQIYLFCLAFQIYRSLSAAGADSRQTTTEIESSEIPQLQFITPEVYDQLNRYSGSHGGDFELNS
jgi:hypothetical protein